MKKLFKVIFCLLIFLLVFFIFFKSVNAEQKGIGINKTIFSFEANAGEEKSFYLSLKNLFLEEQEVQIETGSFDISGNNNEIVFLAKNNEKSIDEWFVLEEKQFKLQANEERNVLIKMKIPENTKGDSYQGILFFKIIPKNLKNDSVNESGAIGVQFLVNVLSDKKNGAGEIVKFETPFLAGKNVNLDLAFKNTGNFYYVSRGEVRVKNFLTGEEKMKALDNHFVFPDKEFHFSVNKNDSSLLGFYRARLIFLDGDGNFHLENNYFFGYLFFPLILIILVVLFLLHKFYKQRKNLKN